MELKHYFSILRRQWLPLILVPAIVAIFVVVQMLGTDFSYTASAQLTVTRAPQQMEIDDFRYNEYYLFLSSEFLVDDLVEIVRGNVFAEDVHARILEEHGIDIPLREVQASISSERRHRILTIDVTNGDEDRALMIAQAATQQLNAEATRYFGFDSAERGALVEPIQFPESASAAETRDQVFWALQILIAMFGGVLLAFFLNYLDDRLHTAEMVEESLDLDVIAEVPRGKVM